MSEIVQTPGLQDPTYDVEDALGMIFILGTLGVEEEPLAALSCLGNIGVGNVSRLLIAEVVGKMAMLQRRLAQPEVLFGEDQSPCSWSAFED